VQESPNAVPLSVPYGGIKFENVRFAYPNTQRDALAELDLSIQPGTLVAVVGRSGAGKSTLLKLITRLYDPSAGRVVIDVQDIKGVTLDSLRSHIAVVPQIPLIFTGSVAENIRLAKPEATDEEVIDACKSADALEFILKLPDGFNARLGQGGANFSGGQIQRIAIARALIRKPRILLLDEPGSALDSESEAAIMATLQHLTGITIIIVGHHLKAMSTATRLIVIDNGRVIEDGVHEALLSSGGLYSSLYVKTSV
jgi:ABC-type multidrug transport system fused ATPase/permease subunit